MVIVTGGRVSPNHRGNDLGQRDGLMRLKNKVAIITGAGRGIGRAIALAYAREGANLSLAARTLSELEETARQVNTLCADAYIVPTDVSDPAQVENMVIKTLNKFSSIDILVNNAAIGGPVAPLQDTDVSAWLNTINVNLVGTYLCCRAVLPTMLERNRGKIINVTSGPFARGTSLRSVRHMAAYLSSKGGVNSLTELLAVQLEGTNVRVNAMGPGGNSRMLEELVSAARQIGDDEILEHAERVMREDPREESAEIAVFLASEASGDLSGRALPHRLVDTSKLPSQVPDIMASDAYTVRLVTPE